MDIWQGPDTILISTFPRLNKRTKQALKKDITL